MLGSELLCVWTYQYTLIQMYTPLDNDNALILLETTVTKIDYLCFKVMRPIYGKRVKDMVNGYVVVVVESHI